jgi:hypothetical protein
MAKRPRHKDKDIEAAIRYAEEHGWYYVRSGSHGWGLFRCPHPGRGGGDFMVQSTPTFPAAHAKRFRREVDACRAEHGEVEP